MKDKIQLLERILNYMPNHSGISITTTAYTPPAQALRNQADRIEQEEADIQEFKNLIEDLKSRA